MSGGTRKPRNTKRTRERHVSIRAIRRDEIDVHKLARALITLAQAEAEAQAEHEAKQRENDKAADE